MANPAVSDVAVNDVAVSDTADLDVNRVRLAVLRLARSIRSNSIGGGVTQSQAAVLATLARHGPSTISHIADHEHVRPPSASKIVANLESRGLVERRSDPADRRCSLVDLSPDGQDYVDSVRAAGRSWLAERVDRLDAEEVDALTAVLPVLERLLKDPQ